MKQTFLVFPAGSTGIALLLLRISVAISLTTRPYGAWSPQSILAFAWVLLAVAVGVGFCTRLATIAALLIMVAIMGISGSLPPLEFANFALLGIALAIIGPGALSIDARLFGRRTVHFPAA